MVIDNSILNPSFAEYHISKQRVEVAFVDANGKTYETKRGTIGKTTGWKPVYLLMLTTRSTGSPYTIGMNDRVLRVIR
jgi:hypothetical protein